MSGNLKDQKNKEATYISKGFSAWKKAPKCFYNHQDSACHQASSAYHLVIPQCSDVGEMINSHVTQRRQVERKYLLDVIKCLKYLARQGIPLQGLDNNDNLTQLLHLLATKDDNITKHLEGQFRHKYTHHDIQNELLNIMASNVLRVKILTIRARKFYSLMADEGTDISNIEQLSFCVRSVDDDFNVSEDFIGFYELTNIKSETIVNAIKDIVLRCHLSLNDCRGQTYDGASNMMGKRSGVSTQILAEQPKAMVTHCQGHSLSLAIKSLTRDCTILSDVMGTVGEICVLVKYSPKREKMLGNILENIEGEFEEPSRYHNQKLDKLCVTRWTVRAKCFKNIINNYKGLLELWEQSLEESLDFETRSRIKGCKAQMKLFKFYFGLSLSQRLYAITDNLSKTLQKEKMSALRGKELADLTVQTLKNIRNEHDFGLFYEKIKMSANKIDAISPATLARKRRKPNYSILYHVTGNKEATAAAYYPENPYDDYKQYYYEALDSIITAIQDRFDQPTFQLFTQVEQLFLKAIVKKDFTDELKLLENHFGGDYDAESLTAELQLLPTIFDNEPVNLEEVVEVLKSLSREKRMLIRNCVIIIRIILTAGATSATPERSFSMLRRIKTWLRSRMGQKRLNSLSILYDNKDLLDEISLIDIGNAFVDEHPDRKKTFGCFNVMDL